MPDENKIRDAADALKGLVDAVPIYQDALQPAAKEVGIALQTVVKAIHVALSPVTALVWGYDQIKDYVGDALTKRLKQVPEERIITPSPTIAGPILEALRFTGHNPELRELYANLLATSMDADTAQNAHPAFVEILRQLSPDEARIVKLFASRNRFPLISVSIVARNKPMLIDWLQHFSLLAQKAGCLYPNLIGSYLDNLCRLGLIEIFNHPFEECEYAELENHQDVMQYISENKRDDIYPPHITRETLSVTKLGRQFCDACVVPHGQ